MSTGRDTLEFRPPPEPEPPSTRVPPGRWVRENLFGSWRDTVLTLVFAPLLAYLLYRAGRFVFVTGRWEIVRVNLTSFMVGRFPRDELWRPWAGLFVLAAVVGLGTGMIARRTSEEAEARGRPARASIRERFGRAAPAVAFVAVVGAFARTLLPIALLVALTVVVSVAYVTGRRLPARAGRRVNVGVVVGIVASYAAVAGFGGVGYGRWGGFMLNAFFTIGGIALSFPLGVLLALGRRSSLPAVRIVCVAYVELLRGVPLVALIFMSWLILPFFLPRGFDPPTTTTRALIAFVLFTAAYVAEIVRGGLQAVPRGQREAAMAVGLSPGKVTRLVVLPQALRAVIPALVGQFISLFKDTSLVFVIGALDLLQVARTIPSQPAFLGRGLFAETLAFASFLFWVGSYWMSKESQRIERRLGVGRR